MCMPTGTEVRSLSVYLCLQFAHKYSLRFYMRSNVKGSELVAQSNYFSSKHNYQN